MLILDQLRKNDPELRLLTVGMVCGMAILLAGLWWVQIVSVRDYREDLQTQSYRTVRMPAERGRILDRTGVALAENRPCYSISLYLEELRDQFKEQYRRIAPVKVTTQAAPFWRFWNRSSQVQTQAVKLTKAQIETLTWQARYTVASNLVQQVGQRLQLPLTLDFDRFKKHYLTSLVLPYLVTNDLSPSQVARFEEASPSLPGMDLQIQSLRYYPYTNTAAHVIGYLKRDDSSVAGEEAYFSYRLPDYRGAIGVECGFDGELHGRAGEKSVLVNNLGYRHAENIWSPSDAGDDVVLTIDLHIQQAAERALQEARVEGTPRGAAVVMDVWTGDVLALASVPSFDPNVFIPRISSEENERLQDPKLRPEINRATQENYAPGSIFKTVVGLACLETGLDPHASIYNPGYCFVGKRAIRDTAPAGTYDFRRAIMFSSNSYFITNGMHAGVENILRIGRRLHLGESLKLPTHQETRGIFPTTEKIHSGWSDGDTANLCIGQGYIDVTPLQMAVLASALANGGTVLWPRLVDRVEPQDPASGESTTVFPKGIVRDHLGVSPRNLKILQDAMRDEVEDAGTGARAVVAGLQICGKTGTAQITDEHNRLIDHTTWFLSFAPYERPRYAVVVMIESGGSGGTTCAPLAARIYEAILQAEHGKTPQNLAQTP